MNEKNRPTPDAPPICAGTFNDYLDAENCRNRLQAAGIPAEILGPNPSSGFGLSMGILSHASVMVPARFAEQLRSFSAAGLPDSASRSAVCHSAQPATPIRRRKKT